MPTTPKPADKPLIDRAKFDALRDADIRRAIKDDPDLAPEMTAEDLARARIVKPARPVEPAE